MEILFSDLNISQVVSTIVYGLLGFLLFLVSLWIIEMLTPFSIRKEIIDEHNTSLAILLGAFYIAMGLIVAAVVG